MTTAGIPYYNIYKQGDIIVIKFPFTDGSNFKKRPCLIISNDSVNKTGDYLVAQITSKRHHDGLSISIDKIDCLKSMPLKSYIRTLKIFTINESLVLSKVTEAKVKFLDRVIDKICSLLKS